ncbi:MAG: hypothetical protein GY941_08845 [Planctomycetes bacterium]|nr:hypothetical protein [Planctomycetota bacterium]
MIFFLEAFQRPVLILGCILIVISNGCSMLITAQRKPVEPLVKKHSTGSVEAGVEIDETQNDQPVSEGAGYLSGGSTVSVGLLDGDEELRILELVRKLEKSLEIEKEMRQALEQNLADMTAAKENVDNEFAATKIELEGDIYNLREEMKGLKAKIEELKKDIIVAESRPKKLEEQLVKAQIAETKARQELFKLKIDLLESGDE